MDQLLQLRAELDSIIQAGQLPPADLLARLEALTASMGELIDDLDDGGLDDNEGEDVDEVDPGQDPPPPDEIEAAPTRVVAVTDSAGLERAALTARPGDRIELRQGEYRGEVRLSAQGTANRRVVIAGARSADPDKVRFTGGKIELRGRFNAIERLTFDRPFPERYAREGGTAWQHYMVYPLGHDQTVRWCRFTHTGAIRVAGHVQRLAVYASSFEEPRFGAEAVSSIGVEMTPQFPDPRFLLFLRNRFHLLQSSNGENFAVYHGKNAFEGYIKAVESITGWCHFSGTFRRWWYSKGSHTHKVACRTVARRGYDGWRNGHGGLMAGNVTSLPIDVDGEGRRLLGNTAPTILLHGATSKPGQFRAASKAKLVNNRSAAVKLGYVAGRRCLGACSGASIIGQPASARQNLNARGTRWDEARQDGLWVPEAVELSKTGRSVGLQQIRADIEALKRLGLAVRVVI